MKSSRKVEKIPYKYVGFKKESEFPSEIQNLRYLRDIVGATKCKGCGWYQLPGRMCPTEGCEEGS